MKAKRLLTQCIVAVAVVAATLVAVSHVGRLAAGTAYAEPASNVSFFNGGGGSANWLPQHSGIRLNLPTAGAYAGITLHHFGTELPALEPTFVTSAYAAGSPRWVIQFADGSLMFGYPAQFGNQWEVRGCPDYSGPMYTTYAVARASCSGEVTAVYIVADGSGGTPENDTITDILYGGEDYSD